MRTFNMTKVCNIRHAINVENRSRSEVAKQYSVAPSTISSIAAGKTYRDIPQAKSVPGFDNYIVYPTGQVWSNARNRFVKASPKRTGSKTRYVRLNNRNVTRSMAVQNLVSSLF